MYKRCARYCVPSNEALNSRWQSYVKSGNKFLICWAGEGTGHLQPGFEQFEISTPLGTIVLWARWDKICQVLLLPGSVKTEWDWGFLPWPFPPSWQGLPESHSAYQFLSKRNLLNYSSKANSTWQTQTQPAVSSTLPTGSSDSAVCVGGCSQGAKMLTNYPAQTTHCCSVLPAQHHEAKHAREVLVRRAVPSPTTIPFLPPQGSAATGWATSAQQWAARDDVGVQQHFKCYPLLPRSSELIPLPPAPIDPCFLTPALLLCPSAGAQSSQALPAAPARLLTPARWDTPQMKGNRASITQNVLAASGFWVFSERVRQNRKK